MDYKISVDSILAELKILDGKKAPPQKIYTMDMIDDIVRTILTKKQEETFKKENREANLSDMEELERAIKHQTKSLTKEFEVLNKIANKFPEIPELLPLPSLDNAIKTARDKLHTERIKTHTNASIEDFNIPDQDIKKILKEHEIIFNNTGGNTQSVNNKNISIESFIELKKNRNVKKDEFILEPAQLNRKENIDDSEDIEHEVTDVPTYNNCYDDIEYYDISQKGKIYDYIKKGYNTISNQLALLGGISIVAILMSFFLIDSDKIMLLGILTMTPTLYGYINLFLLVLSTFCSLSIFTNTFKAIIKQKSSKDILFFISFVFVLVMNIVIIIYPQKLLEPNIYIYTSVFIISLFFLKLSYYQKQKVILYNFEMLINSDDVYSMDFVDKESIVEEFMKGTNCEEPIIAKNVKTNFVDRFIEHSFDSDYNDKVLEMVSFLIFPVSILLLGIVFLINNNIFMGLSIASSIMVLATGFMSTIIVSFPLIDIYKIAVKKGFLVPYYNSITEIKDTNAVFMEGATLFPEGSIILHGIKSFQGKPIDKSILYSASITNHMNSTLKSVFMNMLDNKEMIIPVDNLKYEDCMGVSAWTDNNNVLIGNRELMINHSIAIPPKSYEENFFKLNQHIIYLATNGELWAAFIVEFCPNETTENIFYYLNKYDIMTIVHTRDFFIKPDLISNIFGVEKTSIKVMPSRLHTEYQNQINQQDRVPLSGVNNGDYFSFILSIIAAKKLNKCFHFNTMIYILSVIIGLIFIFVGIFQIGFDGVTPSMLLIYLSMFVSLFFIYQKRSNL